MSTSTHLVSNASLFSLVDALRVLWFQFDYVKTNVFCTLMLVVFSIINVVFVALVALSISLGKQFYFFSRTWLEQLMKDGLSSNPVHLPCNCKGCTLHI